MNDNGHFILVTRATYRAEEHISKWLFYREDECHLAAQDAEFWHAAGVPSVVIRSSDGEVMYESKGSPEE